MPTVFLDRDGVINLRPAEGDWVKRWEEFEFLPGASDAIRILKQHSLRVIVVTNQRGISLGRFSEADLAAVHERMTAELGKAGGGLDAIYYCPHAYNSCDCRKPQLGLFLRAQLDFPDIRFADAVMVGDKASDMEAGERLGCRKVLVGGNIAQELSVLGGQNIKVDFSAPTLLEAVTQYLLTDFAPVRRTDQPPCASRRAWQIRGIDNP